MCDVGRQDRVVFFVFVNPYYWGVVGPARPLPTPRPTPAGEKDGSCPSFVSIDPLCLYQKQNVPFYGFEQTSFFLSIVLRVLLPCCSSSSGDFSSSQTKRVQCYSDNNVGPTYTWPSVLLNGINVWWLVLWWWHNSTEWRTSSILIGGETNARHKMRKYWLTP